MSKSFYYTLGIIALILGIITPITLRIYYPTPEKTITILQTTILPTPTTVTIDQGITRTITTEITVTSTPSPSMQIESCSIGQGAIATSTPYTIARKSEVLLEPLEGVQTFNNYDELISFLSRASNILNTYIPYGLPVLFAADVRVVPLSLPAPLPASAKVSGEVGSSRVSSTNIQVEGVDELDIVKTNGRIIAVASSNKVFIADVAGKRVASVIDIGNENIRGLFLVDNRLVVIAETSVVRPMAIALDVSRQMVIPSGISNTSILIYSIDDMYSPELLSKYSITGYVLSARAINSYVYIVTQLSLSRDQIIIPLVNGVPIPVKSIGIVDPLPNYYTNIMAINIESLNASTYSFLTGSSSWMYMSLERLYIAKGESYDIPRAYIEFFKIAIKYLPEDIAKEIGKALDEGNITRCYELFTKYVSSLDSEKRTELIKSLERELESIRFSQLTKFYVFNVDGIKIEYRGSFSVPGVLLDQFAMEELDGYFIVATTSTNMSIKMNIYEEPIITQVAKEAIVIECSRDICVTRTLTPSVAKEEKTRSGQINIYVYMAPVGETRNNVYTIRLKDLSIAGRLEGLAQGERIYAARLIKNTFFLVTFRQIDPLFAIDLTDPEQPKVLGYLKIPGFSEYLHPIDRDRLLGIGVENNGLKISLFDISDPTKMYVVSEIKIPDSWSPVFGDHHAFTIDPDYKTFYIPISWYYGGSGIIAIGYGGDMLKLKKILDHEDAVRVIYIGNETFTISPSSIKIFDTETLEEIGIIVLQ